MTLSDLAIRRPVFATVVSVGLVVLGLVAYSRLGVDLFPDVQFPIVTVQTVYPGASPSEAEQELTQPIEDAVVSLNGVDTVLSYSRDSVSQVIIAFELDVDSEQAAAQVRERVATLASQLPDAAEAPTVTRIDVTAQAIVSYTLSGEGYTMRQLRDIAEDVVKPALEQVNGVANVRLKGGAERQVNIELDLPRLQALNLTPLAIVDRLRAENLNIPGGLLEQGLREVSIRTVGQFESVEAMRQLVIATGQDGSIVRLADVASIEDGEKEPRTLVRSNGESAVVFEVVKASGENTVAVAKAVKERLAALQLPRGVQPHLIVDQSVFVLENAHEVQVALFFGGAMAILVILFFMLDLRSTFISGLALPTSVIATFFLMYVLDFTINMMTLLGLSLAIGLLIDDAIVVRENIMKHLERGEDPITAASRGTREITLAVLATTATLCAVFVPVAFTGGVVGQFFRQFGLTVAGATIISTWVAFTLDPMLSSRMARPHVEGRPESFAWIKRPMRRMFAALDALYGDTLQWVLSRRWRMSLVGLGAVAMLFGSCSLVPLMGSDFVAPEDRAQFDVGIELPAGTSLDEASRLSLLGEQSLKADPNIITVYATVGVDGAANRINWRVVAVPKWERAIGIFELKDLARRHVRENIPNAEISVTDPAFIEGLKDVPIVLYVKGDDLELLAATAERWAGLLRAIPGAADVDIDYSPGQPEVNVRVDRDAAAQRGVPTVLVARTIRAALEGEVAGVYRDGDDEIDIRVRMGAVDRDSPQALAQTLVPSASGLIPVGDVARFERGEGPTVIQRKDRSRAIQITAATQGRALGDIVNEWKAALARDGTPAGIATEWDGQVKRMDESNENLMIALLLGVVFIYLVLAAQFESFIHPLTIMMAVPLAVVGAIVALFLQKSSLSMGAMIGIILLVGLVTKNGILLVDHAVTRVREGLDPKQAMLDAGPARLRPILMTSAAMVLGMLPTALGEGAGSEFRAPMAMGVIGGVISSTFLSLLVVPVFYLAIEGLRRWLGFGARELVTVPGEPTDDFERERPVANPAE